MLDIYQSRIPGDYVADSINKYKGIIDSLEYEKLFREKNNVLERARYQATLYSFTRNIRELNRFTVIDTAYRISHCYTSSDGKHCFVYVVNTAGRIVKSEEYKIPL